MQELFVVKIRFFKFLFIRDKPRLHQLKIITSSRISTAQASLTAWMFSTVRENTIKEGEFWEQMQNLTNLSNTLKFLIP